MCEIKPNQKPWYETLNSSELEEIARRRGEHPSQFILPKFKVGDIVDTPYDGRRKILQVWWHESQFQGENGWMYEIQPSNNPRHKYGKSYWESYVNQGLFIDSDSGLDLELFQPTYPPTFSTKELK